MTQHVSEVCTAIALLGALAFGVWKGFFGVRRRRALCKRVFDALDSSPPGWPPRCPCTAEDIAYGLTAGVFRNYSTDELTPYVQRWLDKRGIIL